MESIAKERCVACRSDSPRVSESQVRELSPHIPAWEIIVTSEPHRLARRFEFGDFSSVPDFANAIGEVAGSEGHHPKLTVQWGMVEVEWWTYAIGGLHRNDFVMAAKTDEIYARVK